MQLLILVVNQGTSAIDAVPTDVEIEVTKKSGRERVEVYPPDEAVSKITFDERLAAALGAAASAYNAGDQGIDDHTSDDVAVSSSIEALAEAQNVGSTLLRRETLSPNEQVVGAVYFPLREGHRLEVIVPVGQDRHVFYFRSLAGEFGESGSSYAGEWQSTLSMGATLNGLPILWGGIGAGGWIGKGKFRANVNWYELDIPEPFMQVEQLENGRIDVGYSVDGNWFVNEELGGFYLSSGFEHYKWSVLNTGTGTRGEVEDMFLSIGLGYLLRFNRQLYLDSAFTYNFSLVGKREVQAAGRTIYPMTAVPMGLVGVGVNF